MMMIMDGEFFSLLLLHSCIAICIRCSYRHKRFDVFLEAAPINWEGGVSIILGHLIV